MPQNTKQTTPPDTLKIIVDGSERELFMSYGLLNQLTKMVGDTDNVPGIFVDGALRDDVLKAVLAERKKSGKIITEIEDLDEVELTYDDVEKLLAWVAEHVMGFLMRSLVKVTGLTTTHQSTLERLASSLGGSQASAS